MAMNTILPSQAIPDLASITPQDATAPQHGGFAQVMEQVSNVLENADQMAAGYAQGKVGLTDAVLASQKADTTFALTMAIRNKALSAYQEIMNLSV
jgi:flagellar hook-basal body complex protein FliE